jgi:16S rRNA (uracil1498-N3)-methyltransferase
MSVNRFFVSPSSFEGEVVRLNPEQAHQVCHVLRLKPGDEIVVLDDSGTEYDVTLTTACLPETVGQVTGQRPARGEPAAHISLFQSLLAREKFEWVLQKATEVGVTSFVPVLTERSIVRAKLIEERKLDRWRRILVEAAEQSQRGQIPKLDQAVAFDEALPRLSDFDRAIVAAPSEEATSIRQALEGLPAKAGSVALLIGPEGGLTEEEVSRARQCGAVQVSLGPRILRTETAAVVASALVLHELGEMESEAGPQV